MRRTCDADRGLIYAAKGISKENAGSWIPNDTINGRTKRVAVDGGYQKGGNGQKIPNRVSNTSTFGYAEGGLVDAIRNTIFADDYAVEEQLPDNYSSKNLEYRHGSPFSTNTSPLTS